MNSTPKALRLQIALMGKVNSGKSSFLNLITGQNVSITSGEAGTTTDMVEKNQELLPLGPVTWIDTAGFGDETKLSEKRIEKTRQVFERANVIVLILEGDKIGAAEQQILDEAQSRKIPVIKVFNQADRYVITAKDGIRVNSLDFSSRDSVLNQLKAELVKICPEEFIYTPPLLGDLAPENGNIVMIVPIDFEAPKGRLIMPQVQAIRDGLDYNQAVTIVKTDRYREVLGNFKKAPDLVICDSQVVDVMVKETPAAIKCTTFSILFARLKGDLEKFVKGAAVISHLQDGDKVLIAECCTHHAVEDDIGKVKIPNLLCKKTGRNLQIDFAAGRDFPENLSDYKLVVQCGGCMFGRQEILSRIAKCENAKTAITNYGVCISELKGVLEKVLEPFPAAQQQYREIKNG